MVVCYVPGTVNVEKTAFGAARLPRVCTRTIRELQHTCHIALVTIL